MASLPEDEEEAHDKYYGGGGGGGGMMKGKKGIVKMAMDREFASYAIKNTKMAVEKHRARKAKKAYYPAEEE